MNLPVKKKKKTITWLKKELDKWFSIYIRTKYADRQTGYVSCYTCGVCKPKSEMQNGHFVSRVYLATRYDEENCRPQCVGCNLFGHGKPAEFANRLEAEGVSTKALFRKAQQITKDFPYLTLIEEYKTKLLDLTS